MSHKERFYATIERRPVDRPCTWLGQPTAAAIPGLLAHFRVKSVREMILELDDDIITVDLPYHAPGGDAIYAAFDFRQDRSDSQVERTLTSPGVFADVTDPVVVDKFNWPDPEPYISPVECRRRVDEVPADYPILGVIWAAHFQDACAAFGMENALIQMYETPEMFRAVINRITDFYLRANEIFYAATAERLDAVLIGNDFGSQTGLMVSLPALREFVFPGMRKLVAQAKRYGLKVFYHSCGSIRGLIPDLVAAGVDVIHPIQALAVGMDAAGLKNDFGDQVSFCGGVDAQHLLVNGTPQQVCACVRELRRLFPTGLIISPSHEAILPDVPPANVHAMFVAAHE